jgi:hypothetical protein
MCIELPAEEMTEVDIKNDMVGKLEQSLYGTRDAAINFQDEIAKFMKENDFTQGRYNPCTYRHRRKGLKTLVHGDDFVTEGGRESVRWFKEKLEKRFEIKTKVVGSGAEEARESRILNRVIRVTPAGWEYEADQRHAEIMMMAMNLEKAKSVSTPSEDPKEWEKEENEKPLDADDARNFRSIAARGNYLAADRADIQYAVKEICRGMAAPKRLHHKKLKRLVRYLVGRPRIVSKFNWQAEEGEVAGYTDSDWAGCKETAKSTSGGAMMRGTLIA